MIIQAQSIRALSLAPLTTRTPISTPNKNIAFPRHRNRAQTRFPVLRCSLSAVSAEPIHSERETRNRKPFLAEVSRTIMELGSVATLSTVTHDGWPLGIGVKFAVDSQGTPVLCLNSSDARSVLNGKSSLHVQLEQCGLRTPQCTILGSIDKPEDEKTLKNFNSTWKKRFGEEVDDSVLYCISVDRILQTEDFREAGAWVTTSDYKIAQPDPLRNCAERLVNEINANHVEDVNRFCNIFIDINFQISEAKLIWIDRLGFDMRVWSPENGAFDVRVPFPAEVTDEKGMKSTFNCMSQLAWEVEKNSRSLDFEKVKEVKPVTN